uniref:AAA+ ATPase domain-containing protein n=1 Tax=Lotharella oceanica TaxID=641309 RepID=A0A7S2XHB6_9EUKA
MTPILPWKLPVWRYVSIRPSAPPSPHSPPSFPILTAGELRRAARGMCLPNKATITVNGATALLSASHPTRQLSSNPSVPYAVLSPSTNVHVNHRDINAPETSQTQKNHHLDKTLTALFGEAYTTFYSILTAKDPNHHHEDKKARNNGSETPLVLLTGESGCGKTTLVRLVAHNLGLRVVQPWSTAHAPPLESLWNTWQQHRGQLWGGGTNGEAKRGTLIFLDDLDEALSSGEGTPVANTRSLGPRASQRLRELVCVARACRAQPHSEVEKAEEGAGDGVTAVVGAARSLGSSCVLAVECFDYRVKLTMPGVDRREEILRFHIQGRGRGRGGSRRGLSDSDEKGVRGGRSVEGGTIAGASLSGACKDKKKRAAPTPTSTSSKLFSFSKLSLDVPSLADAAAGLPPAALASASRTTRPEAYLRGVAGRGSGTRWAAIRSAVRWKDVGGLLRAKRVLREVVVLPFTNPGTLQRLGITPPKGVLLYGPPGTGKTLLARAVAGESRARFLAASIPQLVQGEVGGSVKAVREVFDHAARCAPCVIFLDELQAMFVRRGTSSASAAGWASRAVSQLLLEIDALREKESDVILLAATNAPEALDPALLRPGRLDRHVFVGPPETDKEREEILKKRIRKMRVAPDVDVKALAQRTKGFAGADLTQLCQAAGLSAITRARMEAVGEVDDVRVFMVDFLGEIDRCKPSTERVDMAKNLSQWSARLAN